MKEMEKGDILRVMMRVPGGGGRATSGDVNNVRAAMIVLADWHDR